MSFIKVDEWHRTAGLRTIDTGPVHSALSIIRHIAGGSTVRRCTALTATLAVEVLLSIFLLVHLSGEMPLPPAASRLTLLDLAKDVPRPAGAAVARAAPAPSRQDAQPRTTDDQPAKLPDWSMVPIRATNEIRSASVARPSVGNLPSAPISMGSSGTAIQLEPELAARIRNILRRLGLSSPLPVHLRLVVDPDGRITSVLFFDPSVGRVVQDAVTDVLYGLRLSCVADTFDCSARPDLRVDVEVVV